MMRISLFLGVTALAIVLLAGPYFSGGKIAAWHDQWATQNSADQSQSLPGLPVGWQVINSTFQRGFFSSDLQLQLQPPAQFCSPAACAPINSLSRIHHGPLALSALPNHSAITPALAIGITELDLNSLAGNFKPQPGLPTLKIVTRFGFNGHGYSELTLPAGSHRLSNGTQLEHRGVYGQMSQSIVDNHVSAGDYLWQLSQLKLTTAKATELKLSQAILKREKAQQSFSAVELALSNPSRQTTRLKQLSAALSSQSQLSSTAGEKLLEARIELDAQSLEQGKQAIGPLKVRLQSERLALAPLLQLQSSMKTIYGKAIPAQLQQMALQGVLIRQLPALANPGPHLVLEELRLGIGQENLLAKADLRIAPANGKRSDLLSFLQKLGLDLHIETPTPIMQAFALWQSSKTPDQSADQLLKQWIDKGWLIRKGNHYQSALRLADAHLSINGNASAEWATWVAKMKAQQTQLRLQREGLAGQRQWRKQPTTPAEKP